MALVFLTPYTTLPVLYHSNLVPRVLLGTKLPWWIVVTWFRFIAQILGNEIINFEGGNIIYWHFYTAIKGVIFSPGTSGKYSNKLFCPKSGQWSETTWPWSTRVLSLLKVPWVRGWYHRCYYLVMHYSTLFPSQSNC